VLDVLDTVPAKNSTAAKETAKSDGEEKINNSRAKVS